MLKFALSWVGGLIAVLVITLRLGTESPADLVVDNEQEPREMDPLKVSWHHEIRAATVLFEGLCRLDPATLKPIPAAAERWDVSPDGRTYTFHLRPGLKWVRPDQTAPVGDCTAHDFEWSWRRVLHPASDGEYYALMFCIDGAEEWHLGEKYHLTPPEVRKQRVAAGELTEAPRRPPEHVGITALDDRTFRVRLRAPTPYFLELAAFPTFSPAHRPTVEADPDWHLRARTFTCNGPYMLAEWTRERRMRLVRNEHFWDKARVKARVVDLLPIHDRNTAMLSFESGWLDHVNKIPEAPARAIFHAVRQGTVDRPDFHVHPGFGTYFYRFNCKPLVEHPDRAKEMVPNPLADWRVRAALSLAVDRPRICEAVAGLGRKPSVAMVPVGSLPDYAGVPYDHARDFDPARARRLLEEAGYADRSKLIPIVVVYNSDKQHEQLALALVDGWRTQLGIDARAEQMEFKTYAQMVQRINYMVARSAWFGDFGDPVTFLDLFRTEDGHNQTGWSDSEYDGLLRQAQMEADPAKRAAMLKRAEERLVLHQRPVLPLFQYVLVQMTRPGLEGFVHNPRDWMDLSFVHREQK